MGNFPGGRGGSANSGVGNGPGGGAGRQGNTRGTGGRGANGSVFIYPVVSLIVPQVEIDQQGVDPIIDETTAKFDVVFSDPIDVTTFSIDDIFLSGTALAQAISVTEVAPNDGTTFEVEVEAFGTGTVVASIPAASANTTQGLNNTDSTSTDDTINFSFSVEPSAPGGVFLDLGLWVGFYQEGAIYDSADGNADGQVDLADIVYWLDYQNVFSF